MPALGPSEETSLHEHEDEVPQEKVEAPKTLTREQLDEFIVSHWPSSADSFDFKAFDVALEVYGFEKLCDEISPKAQAAFLKDTNIEIQDVVDQLRGTKSQLLDLLNGISETPPNSISQHFQNLEEEIKRISFSPTGFLTDDYFINEFVELPERFECLLEFCAQVNKDCSELARNTKNPHRKNIALSLEEVLLKKVFTYTESKFGGEYDLPSQFDSSVVASKILDRNGLTREQLHEITEGDGQE